VSEENHVPTLEEVSDKTRNRLHGLGNQRFALSPFSEYFGQWLVDLRDVISEFESSPTISADGQFLKERSQILSNVEASLEERRREEATLDRIIKGLSEHRILLERIEEEYTDKMREIEGRKASENKRLSSNIDSLKEELDRISRMKTGIFRRFSEKAKAQKEAEATQRLNSEQMELALAMDNFGAEEKELRDEYEKKKQPVIEQIRDQQKEIENLEIDGSLETRRAACEALGNAVNELLQRERSLLH
jgi:chromosome segregation ATPase